jgi:hypothetical protein
MVDKVNSILLKGVAVPKYAHGSWGDVLWSPELEKH